MQSLVFIFFFKVPSGILVSEHIIFCKKSFSFTHYLAIFCTDLAYLQQSVNLTKSGCSLIMLILPSLRDIIVKEEFSIYSWLHKYDYTGASKKSLIKSYCVGVVTLSCDVNVTVPESRNLTWAMINKIIYFYNCKVIYFTERIVVYRKYMIELEKA